MRESLTTIAVVLLLAGTVYFVIAKSPETVSVTSEDGRATVSGTFAADQEIGIERLDEYEARQMTAVVGPVYRLHPAGFYSGGQIQVALRYTDEEVAASDAPRLRVGYMDEPFSMWRALESTVDAETREVMAGLSRFRDVALLLPDDVAAPNFNAEIEGLIAAPPEGAVGYEIEVGYADAAGDFVIIDGWHRSGGCAGQFVTGKSTVMTSAADAFSDTLEYQVVAIWQIRDGCPGREVIE